LQKTKTSLSKTKTPIHETQIIHLNRRAVTREKLRVRGGREPCLTHIGDSVPGLLSTLLKKGGASSGKKNQRRLSHLQIFFVSGILVPPAPRKGGPAARRGAAGFLITLLHHQHRRRGGKVGAGWGKPKALSLCRNGGLK